MRKQFQNFFKQHFPHLSQKLGGSQREKGVALLLATFALSMILYIAMEVQYETQIEYVVNNAGVARLKAYYAARSGVEISLLRIKLYQKVKSQLGSQSGVPPAMLDLIWSFPLSWPPILPQETNAVDKSQIDSLVKEAKMDASYQTIISDEGTKIDINDLNSTSKSIREATKKMILQLFENEVINKTPWALRHPSFIAEDLVNNIIDWMDADTDMQKGGAERSLYVNVKSEIMPPNRQFRSLEELRMVAGMTDDIFALISPRLTVYGAKAINPNTAPGEVIQGIHASISNEVLAEVLKRRQDIMGAGQFKDAADFWGFLDQKGARVPREVQEATPISTEGATNFRIKSVGSYNDAISEIEVVTYDLPGTAATVTKAMTKDKADQGGAPASGPAPTPTPTSRAGQAATKKAELPKGPPRIVLWRER